MAEHYDIVINIKQVVKPEPASRLSTPDNSKRDINDIVHLTVKADTKDKAIKKAIKYLEIEQENFSE